VAGLTVASGLHYIYLYSHRKVREELRGTREEASGDTRF
jgi:hypothetical protein